MNILSKIFGNPNERTVRDMQAAVDAINALEPEMQRQSDDDLRSETEKFQAMLKGARTDDELDARMEEILPRAFAVAREASRRVLGMRHFDVQLMGGMVLHRGQIAEMRTGEGKTLVATLPLYLNGLTGKGVHLVTVNDYLSRVGAGWNAPLYHFLGLSTSVITHSAAYIYNPDYLDDSQFDDRLKNLQPVKKQEAYRADIIYGTNNEFGFDYLRDNMVSDLSECAQRELFYAIVDEVDSILIDEARTPLIISAPAEESTDKYYKFAQHVARLDESEDYNVDEKMRAVTLTEAGITKMEKMLGVENIYTSGGIKDVHHIEQALKAHVLFKADRDYVVKDGEVIIVDEFTGRLMPGRRYSEGLHQAIEAKENVKIQRESQTLATITFQNLFRIYRKLAGMTGTAVTEAEEFAKIYGLDTVVIPTNKPMVRKDSNDLIYMTEEAKFEAVVKEVKEKSAAGQPVLVGTISINKNERLSLMLERSGVQANILNAKNHEREAQFIAEAGKRGAVTIATNMAGRGVDIILGGTGASPEEREEIRRLGGLHVIGTERHESRRIDNQLRGRAGRQGDPGSSRFFVSLEDDLMRVFGGDRMKSVMNSLKVPADMPIENSIISKSIESAQKKVEGHNFDIRKHLVEYDDVINKHRESIYKRRREILVLSSKQSDGLASGLESTESVDDSQISNFQFPISKENPNSEIPNNGNAKPQTLADIILTMIDNEIEQFVTFHTAGEYAKEWNLKEIYETARTIFPVKEGLAGELETLVFDDDKMNQAKARTDIIETLAGMAKERYLEIEQAAASAGINWPEMEKQVMIRAIDTMWIEHLEAVDYMRRGIGLRGYGQRDPLVEYKKEAFRMWNELNNLIQKQVVYSVYKIADVQEMRAPSLADMATQFSAPAKTMDSGDSSFSAFSSEDSKSGTKNIQPVIRRQRDDEGRKIGRNDLCPCGSGKKYKKCHGK